MKNACFVRIFLCCVSNFNKVFNNHSLKKGILTLFSIFLSLAFLVSCSKNKASDFNSDFSLFKGLISSFTSGFVSTKSDFRVQLVTSHPEWKPNQELDSDLFEISPNVKGKVIALSPNTIAFVPKNKLEQNTLYQITLKMENIAKEIPENLSDFNFSVKTFKQDFIVQPEDLQSYSKDWYYLHGTLKFADELAFEEAKQLISATHFEKDLKIKFEKSAKNASEFHFIIDSIQRKIAASDIVINWDGSKSDIEQKGDMKFAIPAKNQFHVVKVDLDNQTKQWVAINFSDPLYNDQNFKGLLSIGNTDDLKFTTRGNVLKVYFNDNLPTPIKTTAVNDTLNVDEEENEEEANREISQNRLLQIYQGIENLYREKMKTGYTKELIFDAIKPAVRLLDSGTILPSSNNLKINFEAVNLNAVDVKISKIYKNNILQFLQENELNGTQNLRQVSQPIIKTTIPLQQNNLINYQDWNVYALDLSKIIQPEPGAIYRVEFSFKEKYSLYPCTNTSKEDNQDNEEEEVKEDDVNYSDSYDYYYEEDYNWRESQNPCESYYYYNTKVGINILASDLGVIAKRGMDKSVMIAVSDIVSTDAVSGATVELYNFQQQKIASSETDSDGVASFSLEKYAYFVIVTKDEQSTYLKLDDQYSLSISNFDVAGEMLQKGLKGYLYGERGVWRPGDTLHLGFILNDNANKLPAMHPVKIKLNDPNGKLVYQGVQPLNALNHLVFNIPTESNAPTGSWEAIASVGGARFYKSIKIETIKPNRLKIKNSFNEAVLSSSKKNWNTIQALWLHGAIAKDLKTEVQAKFSQQQTTFKGYFNYVFDDPTRQFTTEEVNIFSGKVDENGKVTIPINPTIQGQAPGMLKAAFITKVYENGGDVSTDVSAITYSPFKSYVGIKTPEVNRYGMLETKKNNRFEVVSIAENGNRIANKNLVVQVYKLQSRWWWDASNDDLSNYSSATANISYFNTAIVTDKTGKGAFSFAVKEEDWGNYLIRVMDPVDGHATGIKVFIDQPYWSGRSRNADGESATILRFTTDKPKYEVGEQAQVFFPSSKGGRALISIENGTKVIKTVWTKTNDGETRVSIPITGDMAPNVYFNISLLQPHASTKNDLPIRMYGIVPIEVLDKNTLLTPKISMPESIRPEQKTTIKISESNGKAMSYTLAIVDDGLLDLTRFKTPNAWDNFFVRAALGVRTWDIYNEVIGAYGGKVNQIFSIGGDADLGGGKAKKANRFKPVVLYYGPFQLEKGATKTHHIQLPKYIGSVRTMVVAADAKNNAYGMAEKTTEVKSPLMLLASLPRKISPSERVTLPVTLFATQKNIKNVKVQISTNNAVKVVGKTSQMVAFTTPEEKMTYFDLIVGQTTGIGKIKITATSGKEKSSYELEVDVTNPNPITTTFQDIILPPNGTKSISWDLFGVAGSNKSKIEIASFPTVDFSRRLDYLIQYPHGCVEQTTSSVFPQLYLNDIMDLESVRKQQIQKNVTAAITRLSSFQVAGGGFSYWPGDQEADDWGTSYAGHFLIEAEKKGYLLPVSFKNKWISFQQKQAKQWQFVKNEGNDLSQAYCLYTLALAGHPDMASMNRLRETIGISNESKLRLAAAYALIKQNNVGLSLLNTSKLDANTDHNYDDFYYGSAERNRAMALETLILLNQKQKAFVMATKLAKNLSSNEWYSTQTTAYALYAMSKFAQSNGGKGIKVQYLNSGKNVNIETRKSLAQRQLQLVSGKNTITIKNQNKNTLFIRVLNSGILPVGKEQLAQNNVVAKVVYKDRKGNPIAVNKLKQGTEFIAEIVLKNLSNDYVENIALTQILPSGYEIVNTRYTDFGESTPNNADYIDIRDDRANYYFGLKANQAKTFKLLLNASYLGTYYLPGLQCEAMYDHNFLARTKGQWIQVVK